MHTPSSPLKHPLPPARFVHGTPLNLFVTIAALLTAAADFEAAVGLWIFAATVSLATTTGAVCDLLLDDLPVTQGGWKGVPGNPALALPPGAALQPGCAVLCSHLGKGGFLFCFWTQEDDCSCC